MPRMSLLQLKREAVPPTSLTRGRDRFQTVAHESYPCGVRLPDCLGLTGERTRSSFLWRPAFPVLRTISGTCGRNHGFRLTAQDVRFEPIVQVQPQLFFGPGRHPVTEVVEPRLGLFQPAARPVALSEALISSTAEGISPQAANSIESER
jgi:hypothetical protein